MTLKWILNSRQRYDLEMLLVGGFAPLKGFLSQDDYNSVLQNMRLTTGELWPMPIMLDVDDEFAKQIDIGATLELCDSDNTLLAFMSVTDKWKPNKLLEAQYIFGSENLEHPGVQVLQNDTHSWYCGGPLTIVQCPRHYDFCELRHTPNSLKKIFSNQNMKNVIAFQTRNPMHRAHLELTVRAAQEHEGAILIHPAVGPTKFGDVDYATRVRCYQKVKSYFPSDIISFLSLLPISMRMAGPREALWHALIRKNYGCSHFIVGRDHAGPGNDRAGRPFYNPYAAQELCKEYEPELGIQILPFQEMVYVKEESKYFSFHEVEADKTALNISGTKLRNMLENNEPIPDWFSFPDVVSELREAYLPKHKKGFTIFFMGRPGAGKTTLAKYLMAALANCGRRNATILDGDVIRRHFGGDLGFSKADRNLNMRRIGYVASEITKVGGIALCAAIAPYESSRKENRALISQHGGYIEIYLSTKSEECAKRDPKRLYAKKRDQQLQALTGVDDIFESPQNAELTIDTADYKPNECVEMIMNYLFQQGWLV